MNVFREHIWLSVLVVFSAFVFLVLSFAVLLQDGLRIDEIGYLWAQEQTSLSIFSLMLALSQVFHPISLIVMTGGLFTILMVLKKYALGWITLLSVVGGSLVSVLFKYFFDIARPVSYVVHEITPAFPSAHATTVAILSVMLITVLKSKMQDRALHTLFAMVMISIAFLTGLSRVYISVHWLTDIAGGFALGVLIGSCALLVYARIHHVNYGTFPNH